MDRKILIGLTEEEAIKVAEENDNTIRVMKRDGNHYFGTSDLKRNRIDVHIENGIIVKA